MIKDNGESLTRSFEATDPNVAFVRDEVMAEVLMSVS